MLDSAKNRCSHVPFPGAKRGAVHQVSHGSCLPGVVKSTHCKIYLSLLLLLIYRDDDDEWYLWCEDDACQKKQKAKEKACGI